MPDDASSPPQLDLINGSLVTHGIIIKYGVDNVVITGVLVDSYSRSIKYASKDEIIGQDGTVQGVRMSDARAEISVSGRLKASENLSSSVKVGATLEINGDVGIIEDVSFSSGSKDFTKVDIKATAYQNVSGNTIYGL